MGARNNINYGDICTLYNTTVSKDLHVIAAYNPTHVNANFYLNY